MRQYLPASQPRPHCRLQFRKLKLSYLGSARRPESGARKLIELPFVIRKLDSETLARLAEHLDESDWLDELDGNEQPTEKPKTVEIEVQWDAGGALLLRQLADMLAPPATESLSPPGTMVELPPWPPMPDKHMLQASADAVDGDPGSLRDDVSPVVDRRVARRVTPLLKFRRLKLRASSHS